MILLINFVFCLKVACNATFFLTLSNFTELSTLFSSNFELSLSPAGIAQHANIRIFL